MKLSFLLSAPPDVSSPLELGPRPEASEIPAVRRFGDPAVELAALRRGAGLLDASDGGRVVVEGADAATFLHRLLANDVRGLAAGEGNESLLLSPQGRVLASMHLARTAAATFSLELPPDRAPGLSRALEAYLFAEDVCISERTEETAPVLVAGPRAEEVVRTLSGGALPSPGVHGRFALAGGSALIRRAPFFGATAFVVDAGPGGVQAIWSAAQAAGATPVGLDAREVFRVEAGEPLFGAEIDETVYPQEAGLEHAFALDKGCYVGQEVVAKIDTYGGKNRALVGWRLADDTPREKGTQVFRAETMEAVGALTSWVRSPRLGTGLALGYARLRALGGASGFRIEGTQAALVSFPLGDSP